MRSVEGELEKAVVAVRQVLVVCLLEESRSVGQRIESFVKSDPDLLSSTQICSIKSYRCFVPSLSGGIVHASDTGVAA